MGPSFICLRLPDEAENSEARIFLHRESPFFSPSLGYYSVAALASPPKQRALAQWCRGFRTRTGFASCTAGDAGASAP
eukprot:scaffold145931_cov38-Prasinocladus_malaysianus.AAC.1